MAQKRNPVSLRLQTRLKGREKRFASCWFTDSFLSQVYSNDLVKRWYLGNLLQKGGSWYGPVSESRLAETCVSIQFLYRRCYLWSTILDRRKEEYLMENSSVSGVRVRAERRMTTSFQRSKMMLRVLDNQTEIEKSFVENNDGGLACEKDGLVREQADNSSKQLPLLYQLLGAQGNLMLPCTKANLSDQEKTYLYLAKVLAEKTALYTPWISKLARSSIQDRDLTRDLTNGDVYKLADQPNQEEHATIDKQVRKTGAIS